MFLDGEPVRSALPELRPAGARPLPCSWQVVHVADRLEEAFQTLARLPARIWPKEFGTAWPSWTYDRGDLNAQLETGQFFQSMRERNIVRRAATAAEITRMEEAFGWVARLAADGKLEVARAVCLAALWANARTDMNKRCKVLGMTTKTFQRRRMHGLTLIAIALVRDGAAIS